MRVLKLGSKAPAGGGGWEALREDEADVLRSGCRIPSILSIPGCIETGPPPDRSALPHIVSGHAIARVRAGGGASGRGVGPRSGTSGRTRRERVADHAESHRQRRHARHRRRPGHAAALGAARPARRHRHQVRLRHRAVRRLHGAPRRPAGALLPTRLGDVGAAQVTTIEGVSGRVAEAVQEAWVELDVVAVRLLPVRPDHVGDRRCCEQRPSPATPTSTAPWPATSAAAAPTSASAPRSTRPRAASPEPPPTHPAPRS